MATVDVIVPARDEAANMAALIAAVEALRAEWPALRHVVLADNGSTDGTASRARGGGLVVVTEPRRGYGAACLAGLGWIEAQGDPPDAVAFLDADLADDPSELPRLCEPVLAGEADLAIGCRTARAEAGALDAHQRFGNALACALLRLTTGRAYRDLGPMRAVRWASLCRLHMRDPTWGWTVEMQFKAARLGMRVVERDVPYRRRRAGRSKISGSLVGSARAGVKIIATIGALWWGWRDAGE